MSTTIGAKPGQTQAYLTAVAMDLGLAVVQDTTGEGKAKMPTGANELCLGIVCAKAEANKLVTLVQGGYYWAKASAPILVGVRLVIAGISGKLVTDPATPTTTSQVVGYAETAAGADGDEFIVRIDRQTIYNP
jgi:hypothetical protein